MIMSASGAPARSSTSGWEAKPTMPFTSSESESFATSSGDWSITVMSAFSLAR